MPDRVTLRVERDGGDALTTVDVSTGWGRTIVLDEGTCYPPLTSGVVSTESRERAEYVVVREQHLPLLASRLGVGGTEIGDVFAAVVELARSRNVDSLSAARRMLEGLGVPFDEETWISYD